MRENLRREASPLGDQESFALVKSLYYGGNMTQGKLLEFCEDLGISMSAGYVSNLLIKNPGDWETEFNEVYREGLASSPAAAFRSNRCSGWWYQLYDEYHL